LPALRAALADVDFYVTGRKSSWFGGCCSCAFLIVFIIVLSVYVVTMNNQSTTVIDELENSTIGLPFNVNIYCLPDTPNSQANGGQCSIVVQYNQGSKVIDPNNPTQTVYVPHPCQKYGATFQLQAGGPGKQITLCQSWGLNDGVFVTSIPNLTKGSLEQDSMYYDIPQDVNAFYLLEVEIVFNNSITIYDFEPLNIASNPNGTPGSSLAQLRLGDETTSFTTTTTYGSPDIGDIGGSAFLLWVVCRFLADIHYRATKPFAGNLEIRSPPRPQ